MNTERGRNLLVAAITWIDEGASVIPAQPRSKKVYYHWRTMESRQPTVKELRSWFTSGVMNLALVCGTGNILVLDFDNLAEFERWQSKAGIYAGTYTESSGKGLHLFFKVDWPVTKRFQECEALGIGHLCLLSPSIHPSGTEYKAVGNPLTPIIQVKTEKLFSLLSEPITSVKAVQSGKVLSKDNHMLGTGGDLLSRIKATFPLLSYVESLTKLKPSGGNGRYYVGYCPLHDDKEPSFWVDLERGLWGCFSPGCKGHQGGDVINLFALANNITVSEAIKALAKKVL